MRQGNIFLIFSPSFREFGCDVALRILALRGAGRVHGLCTGPERVRQVVRERLGNSCGRLWLLREEEAHWLSTAVSDEDLRGLERKYGAGAFGRTVTADRRVGRGFVRGGIPRPDSVGERAIASADSVPQRYVRGLYTFLESALEQTSPEAVFCYAVAGAPAVALGEVCRVTGTPFLRLVATRMGSGHLIDDDPKGRFGPVARRFAAQLETRRGTREHPAADSPGRKQLLAFRNAPAPPEYQIQYERRLRRQTVVEETMRTAARVPREIANVLSGRERTTVQLRRRLARILNAWRRTRASRYRFSDLASVDRKFLYFPLHVEPEASTMVLSPWHTDQVAIIESLSKSAPADLILVVKEHYPMLGMRPRGFYEAIAQMPRVVLLGPEYAGIELIRKAELTVVITGTAAWEALQLSKPTLIVGDSPFMAIAEGFVHEPCAFRLPEAIKKALDTPPASDDTLAGYIDALIAESFDMPSSLLWGNYSEHPTNVREEAVSRIAHSVIDRIDNPPPLV